jgi:phenylalanyl-tRNA synthetase alpha chain
MLHKFLKCNLSGGVYRTFNRFYSIPKRDLVKDKEILTLSKNSPHCNVPSSIASRVGKNIHLKKHHPLNIIKTTIENYYINTWSPQIGTRVDIFDDISPIMNTYKAFDELLIPKEHISRRPSDTYYIGEDLLLRPHTSAHQNEILRSGSHSFLCTGDVYRRDTIDQTHFPIFHQMEGLHITKNEALANLDEPAKVLYAHKEMQFALEGMIRKLFGNVQFRWNTDYFPFTDPSFELEILFRGEWLEVLGCGVIHKKILENCGLEGRKGWAFGLGLERLAMILFEIPDIRLFWSDDDRFLRQFKDGAISKFQPYSKHEVCTRDISFWTPPEYHNHSFFDLVRDIAGEIVEDVKIIDTFKHPNTGEQSLCYRISYRSMDKNFTNQEIDVIQIQVIDIATKKLGVKLR